MPDARRIRRVAGAAGRAPSRIRTLTAAEVLLLAQAPVALPLVAFGLNRWGLGRVQSFLARRPVRRRVTRTDGERRRDIERVAWTVKIAGMYGPWRPNCLQRSVVLWWFLRRRGHEGDLRIGVRRDRATGGLDFHAWIEYEGAVLNDQPDVRTRYATFDRVIAPRDARFD